MSFIKSFFSKMFTSQTKNVEVNEKISQEDERLKSAVRDAVRSEFKQNNAFRQRTDTNQDTQKSPFTNPIIVESVKKDSKKESVDFNHPRVRAILDDYNAQFFGIFKIDNSQYTLKLDENNMVIHVNDKDFADSLAKSNKLSLSYEHIFLRLVTKEFQNFEYRISLRAGNSQDQHQKNIQNLAHKLATRVKKTGQKVTIPAKSSYERSLIHQVVTKFPGLASKSIGPHHQRRLIIYTVQTQKNRSQKHQTQHVHD